MPAPAGATTAREGATDPLRDIERRRQDALELVRRYRPEEAARVLAEAMGKLDALDRRTASTPQARELRARVLLHLAWTAFERHGLVAGRKAVALATAAANGLGRADVAALCHIQAGTMLARSGDLSGALEHLLVAEEGRSELPLTDQAYLLLNRGVAESQLQRLAPARADLADAGRIAALVDNAALQFMALHNQGYVEFLTGDLPRALRLMNQADAMTVDVERGVSQLDRARVLLEAGLVTEAREALVEAAAIATSTGALQDLGEVELDLARTDLLLGDAEASRRLAAKAQQRFRARGTGSWRLRAQLAAVEALSAQRHDPGATSRMASRLEARANRVGEDHVAQRAALIAADALCELGRLDRARARYAAAAPLLRSGSLATRLQAHFVSANLALAEGNRRRVRGILRRASTELATAQQQASSLDLRSAYAVHAGRLADLDVRLGFERGSVSAVFTRSERWRAVSARVPLVEPPPDPEAAELLSRLRRRREDLRNAAAGPERDAVREAVVGLERRIRALDWSRTALNPMLGTRLEPIGYVEALAQARGRAATIVSFLPYAGDLHAVVLDSTGSGRMARLGSVAAVSQLAHRVQADVEAACLPMPLPLRGAIDASLRQSLADLDALLLRPVGDVDRLVVVPSRVLATVPWGMLPSRLGRPTTVTKTVTGWARTDDPSAHRVRVAAVAGPDLAMADEEVRGIGQVWPGARVVGSRQSSAEGLVDVLRTSDLVHIAAHGTHHHESPMFSTVRLADGPVFAHDVPGAGMKASHVVLSACDVGRATIRPGEEALGLTAVLLTLGVRTVVAATARVPDQVTAETMLRYHRELARGNDVATALAMATAVGPLTARAFCAFGADWTADRCEDPPVASFGPGPCDRAASDAGASDGGASDGGVWGHPRPSPVVPSAGPESWSPCTLDLTADAASASLALASGACSRTTCAAWLAASASLAGTSGVCSRTSWLASDTRSCTRGSCHSASA